jgi:uncharacterized membrane protein YeiB
MTVKARQSNSPGMICRERVHLGKRAVFLLTLGLLFYLIWPADILHYYGFYMLIAVLLFNAPDRLLWCLAAGVNIAYTVMLLIFNYDMGWTNGYFYTDFWTVRGFLRNLLFNGFHHI